MELELLKLRRFFCGSVYIKRCCFGCFPPTSISGTVYRGLQLRVFFFLNNHLSFKIVIHQGPYSPSILQNLLSLILQIFLHFESFE